jgi:hypothetical protein
MRIALTVFLLAALGCGDDDGNRSSGKDAGDDTVPTAGKGSGVAGGGESGSGTVHTGGQGGTAGSGKLSLPQVYPLVRASTPTALISNPTFKPEPPRDSGVGMSQQALGGEVSLAVAIQERFYMGGPTELLRIVKDLDDRVRGLDTDRSKHACLTAAPVEHTYALPGGQSFRVKLQCLQSFGDPGSAGAGWVAFGFARGTHASGDDAGVTAADGGEDLEQDEFYLVEGQENGMGGAYRIAGDDVDGWIAVADRNAPSNSQVIMHLITHAAPATSELAFGGAAVGFCSAHIKTSADHIFVRGRTNAPPPPGTPMMAGAQYCDATRAGCFAVSALGDDLGADDPSCEAIARRRFEIRTELDAASEPGANVVPSQIHMYFSARPTGIASF